MKIIVNFDLINSIKNVNESMGPMKVIRNRKAQWAKFYFPLYTIVDMTFNKIEDVPFILSLQFSFLLFLEMIVHSKGLDEFKDKSLEDLHNLAIKLNYLNIDTSYDLLLNSQLVGKDYNIRLNENKIPEFVESKYILVPSYSYHGNIKSTALHQEHVIGSNDYVISSGSKFKRKQLVYSNV